MSEVGPAYGGGSGSGPPDALQFSEEMFSGIISLASEAIVSIDESQRIVLFNTGAEHIFGYTAAEALGEPLDLLIPERLHEVHRRHVRQFGESEVVARRMGERGEIEILGLRKNGEIFPAEASISKLDIGGRRIYTSVLRDISDRVRIEGELTAALEREQRSRLDAEEAAQARDDVLRIVSHDLGNSLSGILVNTRVLQKTLSDDEAGEDARKRITAIRHLAEHMQRLRQDLLDVSRIEAGQLSIVSEMHAPRALIHDALHDFHEIAREEGVALTADLEGDLPVVIADRERLAQVFANLISNAIKFTGESGTVLLTAEAGDGEVIFKVRDSGVGIPAADLPHIFDRFWQAKSANRAGAGLGLAIARGLVEAHGGRIEVESAEHEGSTFSFTLPAAG
ncbi:MAG TPA: PAS domain-containing sensor histidine kinase [Longimicrobiaceae bacterium]|nr:PAS domain-containing sensor histidine kinase [Longimicrobiaceae bacterium]